MTHEDRSLSRQCVLVVGTLVLIGSVTPETLAQTPFNDWREPVVVELDVSGGKNNERLRTLRGDRIQLGPQDSFSIAVDPVDQRGRRFPLDRFELGVEPERECDDRLNVTNAGSGDLTFRAGRGRGRCRVLVFVPGNLNLTFALDFEISGIGATNYTRRQAEEIGERLYRAILQRELETSARPVVVAEIQRGRLENQVSSMVDSAEFAAIRQRSQPLELVEAFYVGMLERTPDSAGINDYLREIRQGRYREAIMNLVQSAEFEASLPAR